MNRNQIVMASIGAVALVAVLGIGYLVVSGLGEKGEKSMSLESARSTVRSLKGAQIAPCTESVEKIDLNTASLAAWRAGALDIAAKGDRPPPEPVSEATFKQKMVDDARDLARLPGGVDGCIAKPEFGFGFQDIVKGAALPEKASLATLQRQWDEIDLFVRTLSASGVSELTGVEPPAPKKPEADDPKDRKARQKKAKAARNAKKEIATSLKYTLNFRATPAAFVKVLNAFAVADRFTVVESFQVERADDAVAGILGGGKGKDSKRGGVRGGGVRGGGRGRGEPEAAAENSMKRGLVTDPAAAMLNVTLVVATYDFGRGAARQDGSATEKKEGAE